MLRPRLLSLLLALIGSGCSMLTPSTPLYRENMPSPVEDLEFRQLQESKFDREAKQLSHEGVKPGVKVQLLLVDRQIEGGGEFSKVRFYMTEYVGTVKSVDGQTVVLKDAIQIIEGRSMNSVPVLSKIPYVSRMFRNSGVGRESRKLSDDVVVPREKIAGAFELSASGAESLMLLQQVEMIGVDYE